MTHQTHLPYQKPSHKPLTTAHLAQTMSLLEMNNQELLEKIEGELSNNPALELLDEQHCPTCHRKLPGKIVCPYCSFPDASGYDSPIVFVSTRRDGYPPAKTYTEESPNEYQPPQIEDLPTYILRQIGSELLIAERPIAAHILTSLDKDGLLRISPLEIAQYHHVLLDKVNKIRSMIQRCDPIGVGSRDPQEALLIQLQVLNEAKEIDPLVYKAISEGFYELSQHQFRALSKMLQTSQRKAKEISDFISENLNPYPARAFWGTVRHLTDPGPRRYHNPDIHISCHGNDKDPQLVIEIFWPIRGTLRVNPDFQKAISQAPAEKSDQWNSDYQKANLLIKCLGQRNHTLVKLMQKLASKQRDFILRGDSHIKPLTRASLAEELEVHESTISRAVASKSVQLPSGQIIPVSRFFDRSLHIRTALIKIIDNETTPLSDTKVVKLLAEKGYNIARRTVAKYRSMEGILPAHLRN